MSERTAIVTLAIGEEFARRWHSVCAENWRTYADRYGYDLICIEEPLDDTQRARDRSPSWQKLLILGQPFAREYERIVWVDSDVVFAPDAPAITEGVPRAKVGAVDEWLLPTPQLLRMMRPMSPETYYGDFGLPGSFDQVVQAGVMVVSPEHHREIFEHVYYSYEDKPGMYFEMRPLSFELLDRDIVHWIDPRFNVLWIAYKAHKFPFLGHHRRHPLAPDAAQTALGEVHCLHFAGEAQQMEFLLKRDRLPRRRAHQPVPTVRSPVVLFLFARPDTSKKVFDAVRQVRPGRLLVVADAPRAEVEGEAERCAQTRALVETVDWECEVSTNYAEAHLGQTERMESGLDWAFDLTEEAIVIEDDCVPDLSFFRFCDELLERYRGDEQVMSIGGTNFQFDQRASPDSYYMSRYSMVWGWATWRRAWRRNDPAMAAWPELRDQGWLRELFADPNSVAYWSYLLDQTHRDRDSWDRAWMFSCWLQRGVHVTPNVNLVSNIGFRHDATHTQPEFAAGFANLPVEEIDFPLRHPPDLRTNQAADRYTDRLSFGGMVTDMFFRVRQLRAREQAR